MTSQKISHVRPRLSIASHAKAMETEKTATTKNASNSRDAYSMTAVDVAVKAGSCDHDDQSTAPRRHAPE